MADLNLTQAEADALIAMEGTVSVKSAMTSRWVGIRLYYPSSRPTSESSSSWTSAGDELTCFGERTRIGHAK